MGRKWIMLAAVGMGLGACAQGTDSSEIASGGAAADQGPEYCETAPEDPTERERWNELCFPGR